MEKSTDNSERSAEPVDWREPFEWQQPAEWEESADLEALAEKMLNDPKIEAALWLLYNREKAKKLHGWAEALRTPPSAEHYRHTYLWDSGFHTMIYSQAGLFAAKASGFLQAKTVILNNRPEIIEKLNDYSELFIRSSVEESFEVVNKQKPNGFIAGTQYAEGWRWYEIEKALSIDRVDKSTNYTQPPVLPLAAMSTYKAMKETDNPHAAFYLDGIYRYMDNFMQFFQTDRRNQANPLIGVVDPHETGWDSATRWDHKKPERKPRSGADTHPDVDEDNRYMDGTLAVMRQIDRFVWARNNPDRLKKLFWENDVSMNAIYFHNLQVMTWLSDEMAKQTGLPLYLQKGEEYRKLSEELQAAIKDRMWFVSKRVPQKGFYSIKSNGEPNPDISPSNLFALVVPDLSEAQLEAVLDMMDEHFDVEFPWPSTSTKSPEYDPDNREADRLWRGPTWINANFYIVEFGLIQHSQRTDISERLRSRCRAWAIRVTQASNELIDLNHPDGIRAEQALDELAAATSPEEVGQLDHVTGAWEHYHPHIGTGQRSKVRNFGWTWLARFMTLSNRD